MKLAFDFLREVAAVAPTVVLAGNHDSAALLELFGQIVGPESRIHFVAKVKSPSDGGILEFAGAKDERLRLAPLPFVHPNRVVGDKLFEGEQSWMGAYANYIRQLENMLGKKLRQGYAPERDILLFSAHMHLDGAQFSGSERPITVTDAYGSDPENIPPVSYAAMGHIHKPQALPGLTPGRYAGSPIQMDFGEEDEEKGIVIVDCPPGEPAQINVRPLRRGRQLKRLEGSLAELGGLSELVGDQILRITVKNPSHDPHLSERVAELFPKATLFEVIEESDDRKLTILDRSSVSELEREASFNELFAEFLIQEGTRSAAAKEVLASFEQLLTAVEEASSPHFPEESALCEAQRIVTEGGERHAAA
jgi:exonuclease SbcD